MKAGNIIMEEKAEMGKFKLKREKFPHISLPLWLNVHKNSKPCKN